MKSAGYQHIDNDIIDVLIDNPALLQLYIFLKRHRRTTDIKKNIGGQIVTIKKGQIDIGRKQLAKALSAKESTVYRHLQRLVRFGFISVQNVNNVVTAITVTEQGIQPSTETESEQRLNNVRTTIEHTNNKVIKYYSNIVLRGVEILNLKKDFNLTDTQFDECIQNFSELKEMKGYKYKSDYLALRNWGVSAYREKLLREKSLEMRGKHPNVMTLEERQQDGYDI